MPIVYTITSFARGGGNIELGLSESRGRPAPPAPIVKTINIAQVPARVNSVEEIDEDTAINLMLLRLIRSGVNLSTVTEAFLQGRGIRFDPLSNNMVTIF